MRRIAIAAAALAAAACAQGPQTYRDLEQLGRDYQRDATQQEQAQPGGEAARDTCGASRFQSLIGAPEENVDRAALPQGTRVIHPDDAITMDFNALRLNVRVGADGKVAALECF